MFDWDEFKVLATRLKAENNEASQRTAISRVYYAIYWNARNYLVKTGYRYDRNKSAHKQIWDEYLYKRDLESIGIGKKGKELHGYRIKADYHGEIRRLPDVVEDSFDVAEKVMNELGKFQ